MLFMAFLIVCEAGLCMQISTTLLHGVFLSLMQTEAKVMEATPTPWKDALRHFGRWSASLGLTRKTGRFRLCIWSGFICTVIYRHRAPALRWPSAELFRKKSLPQLHKR